MPDGTKLSKFAKRFPDRYFDVGIAEAHAVCFAAGAAAAGLRPVCAIYSTFLQRAYDQVVHDVCVQNLPVVFCMDRSGLIGDDGPTHMGLYDVTYLRALPNITIMAPRDEDELLPMLEHGLTLDGPSAIRYPRGSTSGRRRMPVAPIVHGKAEILRQGSVSRCWRSEIRLRRPGRRRPARPRSVRHLADGRQRAFRTAPG